MIMAATGHPMFETRPVEAGRTPVAAPLVNTTCIDPLSDPAWDRLVATHPDVTFFHSSAWAKVLHATYGHEPVYHRFYRGHELAAMLPMMEVRSMLSGKRGVCLPFTDACGPLYFGGNQPSQAVMDHLAKIAQEREWKHFEVRETSANLPGSIPSVSFYHHHIALRSSLAELFDQFASSVRRSVRKAEQQGVVTEISIELNVLLDFYRLHVATRKRHGLPPQPVSFFRNIHEHVLKARLGFVVLARHQSRPIAGAVFFHSGKKALYKFGASDASQQKLRGNNLAMWEGIKALVQRGFATLDLGRTSRTNDGLRRFKLGWGAEERVAAYTKFDSTTQGWVTSRDQAEGLHNIIFRHLPAPLNRMAGTLLYPHLD